MNHPRYLSKRLPLCQRNPYTFLHNIFQFFISPNHNISMYRCPPKSRANLPEHLHENQSSIIQYPFILLRRFFLQRPAHLRTVERKRTRKVYSGNGEETRVERKVPRKRNGKIENVRKRRRTAFLVHCSGGRRNRNQSTSHQSLVALQVAKPLKLYWELRSHRSHMFPQHLLVWPQVLAETHMQDTLFMSNERYTG
jgi:hypothetical protein